MWQRRGNKTALFDRFQMLENTAASTFRSGADRVPAKARSRTERARYNGRSREARSVRRLIGELKGALGGAVDAMTAAAIQRAAELSVIAATLRAGRLRGEAVDIAELIKAENAARRAVADLGIRPGKAPPAGQTLNEYLAGLRDAASADAPGDETAEKPAGELPRAAAEASGE